MSTHTKKSSLKTPAERATPRTDLDIQGKRLLFVENLRIELICGVLVNHLNDTYGAIGAWEYRSKTRLAGMACAQLPRVIVRMVTHEGNAFVSVQDLGIGISEAHQEKIFERFYQVTEPAEKTYSGLGIGLYIARKITEGHHRGVSGTKP